MKRIGAGLIVLCLALAGCGAGDDTRAAAKNFVDDTTVPATTQGANAPSTTVAPTTSSSSTTTSTTTSSTSTTASTTTTTTVTASTAPASTVASTVVAPPTLSRQKFTSAKSAAAALVTAGIPCSDYEDVDSLIQVGPDADLGRCTAGDFTLKVAVMTAPTDVPVYLTVQSAIMKSFQVPVTPIVVAGNVVIAATPVDVAATKDLFAAIAKALAGDVDTITPAP